MSPTNRHKYKYFHSTVQGAKDRRQKFHFCRLPFDVPPRNVKLNLSNMRLRRRSPAHESRQLRRLYLSWNLKFPNNNLLLTNRSTRRQTNNAQCQRGSFYIKLSVTATEASQRSPAPRSDKINWKNCLTYPRCYRTNRQLVLQVVNSSSLIEFCTLLEELYWIDVRVTIDGWMPN